MELTEASTRIASVEHEVEMKLQEQADMQQQQDGRGGAASAMAEARTAIRQAASMIEELNIPLSDLSVVDVRFPVVMGKLHVPAHSRASSLGPVPLGDALIKALKTATNPSMMGYMMRDIIRPLVAPTAPSPSRGRLRTHSRTGTCPHS
eukprot:6488792-Prymnesium_polylepis.1